MPRLELKNPVKEKLLGGEVSIGSWSRTGEPLTAETVAAEGFDWVMLDIEHFPVDVAAAANCYRAVQLCGAMPFARLPFCDHGWIKRFLDAGAMGIVVPLLRTAADARNLVEWSRFPPLGRRPYGGGRVHYLYGRDAYIAGANDAILVLAQVETPEAVENLDEMLAVEGIDGFFVGPTDLALSLGLPLPGHPSRQRDELVASLAGRIRAAGKVPATVSASPDQAAALIRQGYRMVSVGCSLAYIQQTAAAAVADLRRRGLA